MTESITLNIVKDGKKDNIPNIVLDTPEKKTYEGFQKTLETELKIKPSEWSIFYKDADEEIITLVEKIDFDTLMEEYATFSESDKKKGINIILQTPTPEEIRAKEVSSRTTAERDSLTSSIKLTKPPSVRNRLSSEAQAEAESPGITSEIELGNAYKFDYTEEDMEVIKKVNKKTFAALEDIFQRICDQKLEQDKKDIKKYIENRVKNVQIRFENFVKEAKERVCPHCGIQDDGLEICKDGASIFASSFMPNEKNTSNISFRMPNQTIDSEKDLTKSPAATEEPQEEESAKKTDIPQTNHRVTRELLKSFKNIEEPQYGISSLPPELGNLKHFSVACDGCGLFPLQGIRYKSVGKRDFDLCHKCFMDDVTVSDSYIAIRFPDKDVSAVSALARAKDIGNYRKHNRQFKNLHDFNQNIGTFAFPDL